MNRILRFATFFIIFLSVKIIADVPAPGVEMPENIRRALLRIGEDYQKGNLSLMMQQKRNTTISRAQGVNGDVLEVEVPLLLGRYSNNANTFSRQDFEKQIFEENPTGTMIDYYREVSYGQFELSGATYGWHILPGTRKFYVGDDSGLDGGGARFARDLAMAADPTVDFSRYDADDNGYVDVIMVVHTGAGAETGESSNIWSHRWSLNSAASYNPSIMPDGEYVTDDPWPGHPGQFIKINDYIIQPELASSMGGLIEIGVFCHEFGHALGLPDLYDTDYSSSGIGRWGLMAGGSYGGDGRHSEAPAHMCAWSKEFLGWIDTQVIDLEKTQLSILNTEENSDQTFKININTDGNPEYFLIENRQKIGFDKYLTGNGLLIWHIDQGVINRKRFSNSVNNDERRKGVDLEEADGRKDLDSGQSSGDSGDPFPGSSNNRLFNSSSDPDSDNNDNVDSGIAIQIDNHANQIVTVNFLLTPDLSVSPFQRDVAYTSGTVSFSISNIGGGLMQWSAFSNSEWLSVVGEGGGTNKGELLIDFDENDAPESRTGSITVTADGDNQVELFITQSATGEWILPIAALDNGGEGDTVFIGQRFGATAGLDLALGESVLPPTPERGVFDIRLNVAETGSMRDFRAPGSEWKEWQLLFQAGEGGFPLTLTWDKNRLPNGSFYIHDEFTGNLIAVNMKMTEKLEVPTTSIKSLRIIFADAAPQKVAVKKGWNLVSVPFLMLDMRPRILFPDAASSAFAFSSGYERIDTVTPGNAFWIKTNRANAYELFGSPMLTEEIQLNAGWNLVGPFDKTVQVAAITTIPDNILDSEFFAFDKSYTIASELFPGSGYWIKAIQDGKMVLNAAPVIQKVINSPPSEKWAVLTVTDAVQRRKVLYITDRKVNGYHLPPMPPGDAWDVRFNDDRRIRMAGEAGTIQIHGAAWPVSIKVSNNDHYKIDLMHPQDPGQSLNLSSSTATINSTEALFVESQLIPNEYRLSQNYPNPFNPSTTIAFDIPKDDRVVLRIYDARGRLVKTVMDKLIEAGNHKVLVDAAEFASGIYIYRMETSTFRASKKMIVLR